MRSLFEHFLAERPGRFMLQTVAIILIVQAAFDHFSKRIASRFVILVTAAGRLSASASVHDGALGRLIPERAQSNRAFATLIKSILQQLTE